MLQTDVDLVQPSALARMPADERNARLLDAARLGAFDFVDFGTHKGAGIDVGIKRFGGSRGLGIELAETKSVQALARGYYVYQGDVLAVPLADARFRFATCRHVLEHLPNKYVVGAVLWKLATSCHEFLYIEQPYFDDREYLADRGLTLRQYTATYHTCQLRLAEFKDILATIGVKHYVIGGMKPIKDASHREVHALDSPPDRSLWVETDRPKPNMSFDRTLYGNIVVLADLGGGSIAERANSLAGLTVWESV